MSISIIETNWNWSSTLSKRASTEYIALHHAAASSCSAADVDRWHKANGWSGIGYHFFVRKDGSIYRGRPIDKMGAHVSGKNNCSIGICAEGDYTTETMPAAQKTAICGLLVYLIDNYYPSAQIVGHKEIGSSDCPGTNYPLEDIKSNYRTIAGASSVTEYTEINDIIWELAHREIISNKEMWLTRCAEDTNIYWFCRKLCQYIRTKQTGETADSAYTDINDIIWDLQYRGIITDTALWTDYCNRDINVYHLLRKGLHYCRTY